MKGYMIGAGAACMFVYSQGGCKGDDTEAHDAQAPTESTRTTDISDTGTDYDPSTATLTIRYDYDTPVTLTKDGVLIAAGYAGDTFTVGEGAIDLLLGPYDEQTDVDFYPEEDGYTEDGLPMVIVDDRRFIFRGSVDVDQRAETVVPSPLLVVGEGTYGCAWTKRSYDEANTWTYGDEWLAEAELFTGRIALERGTDITPDDAMTNLAGMLKDGDRLFIEADPDGPYSTRISLESPSGNELRNAWIEGRGLADFGGITVDLIENVAYEWSCMRDWSAYNAAWYYEHGGD